MIESFAKMEGKKKSTLLTISGETYAVCSANYANVLDKHFGYEVYKYFSGNGFTTYHCHKTARCVGDGSVY